jgi:site-specific recombinase XerD
MHEQVVEYLRHVRCTAAQATYTRKRQMAVAFATWCERSGKPLGVASLATVGCADIERYLLSRSTWSHATRRMHWRTIHELYAVLGYVDNPAEGIVLRRHQRPPLPRLPSKGSIGRLFGAKHNGQDLQALRDRLMAELAYGSGLRREEMVRLDIEDIDLEQGTVYVHGKGGRTRIVPLTAAAMAVVRRYLERRRATRGPLLVAEQSMRRLKPVSVDWVFRRRLGVRPHGLRHACATHMLANGCSLRFIQELLGHVNLRSTERYTHITKQGLARILARYHPMARNAPSKATQGRYGRYV